MALLSDLMQYVPPVFPLATTTTPGAVLARGYGAELPLGTPTFNGGVAPTTPNLLYKSYFWNLIDHQVFLYWQALWSTGGTLNNYLTFPFPSDLPAPWNFAAQPSNSWIIEGSGGLHDSTNLNGNGSAMAGVFKETGGTLSLKTTTGSLTLSAKFACGSVTYPTAG